MDPDNEAERSSVNSGSGDDEEDSAKFLRPPSSYGSMKSDSEKMEDTDEDAMEGPEEVAAVQPEISYQDGTGMQLIRSESPETLFTIATMQTKPPGAQVLETRSDESLEIPEEEDEEDDDDDDGLITNSPEPPEVVVPESSEQADENGQPGTLHPENDLPHIFKSIQSILSGLTSRQFYDFKTTFRQWEPKITREDVMDDDVLNFVDKTIEVLGRDESLLQTIRCLELVKNEEKAEELQNMCKRVLTRHSLRAYYRRKHCVIHEGVVRAGGQNMLRKIYMEPELSTDGRGGVDPSHELRNPPPPFYPLPSADTFVSVSNLFRLRKRDGTPVRTVVTTGLPGTGMSVSVAKFALDWAEEKANRDIQFVIKLSFPKLWGVRERKLIDTDKVSMMDVFQFWYPDYKQITYLENETESFLLIMDGFDCYRGSLDWENAPVVKDLHTKAHPDDLVVNIIRGDMFPGARKWILGRRAAVSQIPAKFIDILTEHQGFSDEVKDIYLMQQTHDEELGRKIVAYFRRLPALVRLARHPFVCWIVFAVYKQCYGYRDFGHRRPRLTLFYVSLMLVQMNRRLQFYYGQFQPMVTWSEDDKKLLLQMGKMALKMLEREVRVFSKEDLEPYHLDLTEVTVLSGMCTELPADGGRRRFCFIHYAFQEFLAALYVFLTFRLESKNVLESGIGVSSMLAFISQPKSPDSLLQCALARTLNSRLGHYDMFLRFLCGLLNVDVHDQQLCGYMYPHSIAKISGLKKAEHTLKKAIQNAPEDRLENLKECLREMTQEDS
ncbi:NACHT, LRR and PYD domains-containing protein 3 [Salarias fasciatus]|uniref:NACHT, LRR and PYD domains-containing protein 3-like n=1 Tax=Salarias fasciatus TaxID=181472 RepID=A0A672FTH3_SALFA|nr:NACHT, LRR and PYD domains-containing protein 3-like [Salarias fasciatus]